MSNKKPRDSFDVIGAAFDRTPKWRCKELKAKRIIQEKRDALVESVRLIGADDDTADFDEDIFTSLFDANNPSTTSPSSAPPKKKKRRQARPAEKKRRLLAAQSKPAEQSPLKKRKLNDPDDFSTLDHSDFTDKGVNITTIHVLKHTNPPKNPSSSTKPPKTSKTLKNKKNNSRAAVISQINRFDMTQLMVRNIPPSQTEETLSKQLITSCSVDCVDIHLFHNTTHPSKPGHAVFSFACGHDCALAYKHLSTPLTCQPISHQHKQKRKPNRNNACSVLKLSNLHYKTSKQDIKTLLHTNKTLHKLPSVSNTLKNVSEGSINIHKSPQGCPTGQATVELEVLSSKHGKTSENVMDEVMRVFGREDKPVMLLGRPIAAERALNRTGKVFADGGKEFAGKTKQIAVFNVAGEVLEPDLYGWIEENVKVDGKSVGALDVHLIHHLEVYTPGYAFVKFDCVEKASCAVRALNGLELCGRQVSVVWSKPSRVYALRWRLAGKSRVVTCTNLKYDVREEDVVKFLGSGRSVERVEIMKNAKGFRYGMCKVWFGSCEQGKSAVEECNGKRLKGRVVNMNYWQERGGDRGKSAVQEKKVVEAEQSGGVVDMTWDDTWFQKNVDQHKGKRGKRANSKKELVVPEGLLKLWG